MSFAYHGLNTETTARGYKPGTCAVFKDIAGGATISVNQTPDEIEANMKSTRPLFDTTRGEIDKAARALGIGEPVI